MTAHATPHIIDDGRPLLRNCGKTFLGVAGGMIIIAFMSVLATAQIATAFAVSVAWLFSGINLWDNATNQDRTQNGFNPWWSYCRYERSFFEGTIVLTIVVISAILVLIPDQELRAALVSGNRSEILNQLDLIHFWIIIPAIVLIVHRPFLPLIWLFVSD